MPLWPCRQPQDGDSLAFVGLCSPTDSVLIAASNGRVQHFPASVLRRMSRTASGVKVGRRRRHAGVVLCTAE